MGVLFSWTMSVAMAIRFKRGVEQYAAISILLLIAPVLACGRLLTLDFGVNLSIIVGCISIAYIMYGLLKNGAEARTVILSASSVVYLSMLLLIGYLSIGRGFTGNDEFNYWGRILKSYSYGESFPYSRVIHPGSTTLWQLIAEKTWITYSESIAIWATAVMIISFMMPLLRFTDRKQGISQLLAIASAILLIPFVADIDPLAGIQVDAVFGAAFGFVLISIYEYLCEGEKFYLLRILVGLVYICSIKRVGIVLYALISVCFVFWCLKRNEPLIRGKREQMVFLTCAGLIPPFVYIIWGCSSLYAAMAVVVSIIVGGGISYVYDRFGGKIKNAGIIGTLTVIMISALALFVYRKTVMPDWFLKTSIISFFTVIFTEDNFFRYNFIRLSPAFALIVFNIFMLAYRYICKKKGETVLENNVYKLCILTTIVALGYIGIIFAAQMNTNIAKNNPYSPALSRYMKSLFYPLIMITFCFVLYARKYRLLKERIAVGSVLLLMMVFMADIPAVCAYFLDKKEEPRFYGFSSAGIELTEDDRVFYIQEVRGDEDTDYGCAFEYELYPVSCNRWNAFHYMVLEQNDGVYMDPETFISVLVDGGYTYVYMQSIDEKFAAIYGNVVDDAENIESGDVYVLYQSPQGMRLRRHR